MSTTIPTLAPCPFCGESKAKACVVRDGWRVVCACGASGRSEFHGPASMPTAIVRAAEAWNGRAAAPDMLAALLASEREYRDLDDAAPLDPGCTLCTDGTTPHNRDTGLCAHHLRVAAIRKAGAHP